jgi:RNA polymerase sigma factor (TIGR02999 family)
LQATALVHEAYLRLVAGNEEPHWNSRGHFFGAAAEAMRRILVDRARQLRRMKHGGELHRVEFDSDMEAAAPANILELDRVLDVDAGLEKLAAESPIKAELVKLRFFAGMTIEEAADALGISRATADRYWAYAKVFLYSELHDQEEA